MGILLLASPPIIWDYLRIGAGGFISGIDLASDGTAICRTDTYGGYKLNRLTNIWSQLLTTASMPAADSGIGSGQGIYELKLAPSNTSRFYMIYNGYVFRSDNSGASWVRLSLAQDTSAAANDAVRGDTPKLAVDPQNADVVFVSTPTTGVSHSSDAGVTWTTVATGSIPASGNTSGGVSAGYLVSFDPSSSVIGGKTQGLYVSSYGNGVYHSTDGGSTWAHVTSSPTTHTTLVVDPNGLVWFADASVADGIGVLFKYTGSGSWPSSLSGAGTQVAAVAYDPGNVGVGTTHIYASDNGGHLKFSLDSGSTWTSAGAMTAVSTDTPWIATEANDAGSIFNGAGMKFDPSQSNVLAVGAGLGFYTTSPPTTNVAYSWTLKSNGIEQLVTNWIISPPSGNPLVAVWDDGIFTSLAPTTYPSTKGVDFSFAAGWSCDWASSSSGTIVALCNWTGTDVSGKSTDGGATWAHFGTVPPFQGMTGGERGGCIAASSSTNYVMVRTDDGTNPNQPYYTTDGGATWTAITMTGVPTSGATGWNPDYVFDNQTLCADRVDANTFYMHNNGQGTGNTGGGVWKSTNSGASWTRVSTSIMGGAFAGNAKMRTVPNNSGHLFRSSGSDSQANFERSTDHGASWSAVPNVTEVWAFGFGPAAPGQTYPSIFIAGYVNSVWGIYRSDDDAVSWKNLGGFPLGRFDTISCVEGDANTYGTVYVGFRGSGAIYGRLA